VPRHRFTVQTVSSNRPRTAARVPHPPQCGVFRSFFGSAGLWPALLVFSFLECGGLFTHSFEMPPLYGAIHSAQIIREHGSSFFGSAGLWPAVLVFSFLECGGLFTQSFEMPPLYALNPTCQPTRPKWSAPRERRRVPHPPQLRVGLAFSFSFLGSPASLPANLSSRPQRRDRGNTEPSRNPPLNLPTLRVLCFTSSSLYFQLSASSPTLISCHDIFPIPQHLPLRTPT
jgi:hypothetical protein